MGGVIKFLLVLSSQARLFVANQFKYVLLQQLVARFLYVWYSK